MSRVNMGSVMKFAMALVIPSAVDVHGVSKTLIPDGFKAYDQDGVEYEANHVWVASDFFNIDSVSRRQGQGPANLALNGLRPAWIEVDGTRTSFPSPYSALTTYGRIKVTEFVAIALEKAGYGHPTEAVIDTVQWAKNPQTGQGRMPRPFVATTLYLNQEPIDPEVREFNRLQAKHALAVRNDPKAAKDLLAQMRQQQTAPTTTPDAEVQDDEDTDL